MIRDADTLVPAAGTAPGRARFALVDLDRWRDNIGGTDRASLANGGLNVWRNSLPAEQLPGGRIVTVDGVPFRFPVSGGGRCDNVRCTGQLIPLPPGRYDWLYLLGVSERRTEDEVAVHFAAGEVDFEPLRLSDFWAAPARFGESPAVVSTTMHYPHHVQPGVPGTIWCQRVAIVRRAELTAVRLPHNVAVHVFALTLCREPGEAP